VCGEFVFFVSPTLNFQIDYVLIMKQWSVAMFGLGKGSKMVLCVCRSCSTLNPSTGLYEGKMVARSTRDNHGRDDKIYMARQNARFPRQADPTYSSSGSTKEQRSPTFQLNSAEKEAQLERVRLMGKEVDWLSELPVTSLEVPLVFKHSPETNGEYQFPSDSNLVRPNYGLHALATKPRANAAFLQTEVRYCELLTILKTEPQLGISDVENLIDRIRWELERICHEKALQWAQQRVHVTGGPTWVNTGRSVGSALCGVN
jgi:hypothetical protein